MTEASSKGMTAGPVIGGGAASSKDIVNGLDGLRLLFRYLLIVIEVTPESMANSFVVLFC